MINFLAVALHARFLEILLFKVPLSPLGSNLSLVGVSVDLLLAQYLFTLADIASVLHLSPSLALRFGHLSIHLITPFALSFCSSSS